MDKTGQTNDLLNDFIRIKHTGVAASIIIKDEVVWSGVYGKLDASQDTPVTKDTLFMVASISKIVTAVAVLQLYEQGLISLDADINQYIKVKVSHPHTPMVPITPRMLLQHKSGISDSEQGLVKWRVEGADSEVTLEEQVKRHLTPYGEFFYIKMWSKQPPGEAEYWYSNAGFTLLGYLVEQVSRTSFNDYTRKNIFEPIGIRSVTWFLSEVKESQVAVPHCKGIPIGHYGIPEYPAGQLRISVNELSEFLKIFTCGSVNGIELLKKETLELMCPDDFCNGLSWWGKDTWYGEKSGGVWTHGGFMTGVRTHVYFFPEKKSAILILTNDEYDYGGIYKILLQHLHRSI